MPSSIRICPSSLPKVLVIWIINLLTKLIVGYAVGENNNFMQFILGRLRLTINSLISHVHRCFIKLIEMAYIISGNKPSHLCSKAILMYQPLNVPGIGSQKENKKAIMSRKAINMCPHLLSCYLNQDRFKIYQQLELFIASLFFLSIKYSQSIICLSWQSPALPTPTATCIPSPPLPPSDTHTKPKVCQNGHG